MEEIRQARIEQLLSNEKYDYLLFIELRLKNGRYCDYKQSR